ncbi:hypothetical protein EX895_006584 [Sporisorium graminicola]|uniref:Uncharacterized protein n=1 Tax=Sporisorium graminicola TaxID=280036 RepID=A0A4U7KP20_9BASI|nr:hypothetical protein EX895_006584 [Sporisorium graminicola]TKY84682.1 hypothetical protein EX895_006584 [Sporisorium graminicola]
MPPSRKHRPDAQWDESSSTLLPRPRGRPHAAAANVSLSSTLGAPTPARPSSRRDMADYSIVSTLASSTPAAAPARKRGRPPKHALTTPSMMALASADTSIASTSYGAAAPRPRGRPPKSILSTPGSRTLASPPNSVSFSDQSKRRGRPPKKSAAAADASMSTAQGKRRGRPPGSVNKPKQPPLGLPKGRPSQAPRYSRPDQDPDSASDVSLIDGASATDDDSASQSADEDDDEQALSSEDEARQRNSSRKKAKRKGWPSERERLRKWRRLSVEERECVTSEGGLIWRTAIPLLNSMPKNIRSMVADSLTRALNRIDAKLESGLVPPLARLPQGSLTASTAAASTATRRDLASSMLSWRLEEEGSLLRAENPDQPNTSSNSPRP